MDIYRIVNGLELFEICGIQPALREQLFLFSFLFFLN